MAFDTFLHTSDTIPDGQGFELYGLCHILWILFAVLVCVVLCLIYHRSSDRVRGRILKAAAILMLLDELFKHTMLLIGGRWEFAYLPLHLCSINIFVCTAHAYRPTLAKADFLYALCLPAALCALFFPSWTALPFGNFMHMHSFTVHILLALYPLLLLSGGYRPSHRRLKHVLIPLLIVCPIIFVINKLTDCNFMFLNRPGSGNPLTLFAVYLGNPGYLIGFPILLAIIWLILYLPPYFAERGKKKLSSAAR